MGLKSNLRKKLNHFVRTASKKFNSKRAEMLPIFVVNKSKQTFNKDQEKLLNMFLNFALRHIQLADQANISNVAKTK